ncbi:unnamed protein product [Nyctereutes procyonoides]|uniref:(raccoon dog) hypothetical protein n=1 Tax=Nyctereutes procyonoides TaxID=34880 RepID=A0A811Y079_NYCPR|nr:unnamed protein product [Nyctereutes procyonoides]
MTQLCLPRPKGPAYPIPVPPRGLSAGEGPAQLWDSVLGLGALGLTVRAVFSTAVPVFLLLLLLLVSFLTFDLFHWPGPTTAHTSHSQSQGAGEGPGLQEAVLLPPVAVTGQLSPQKALLLLLLSLGLLLGACSMPLALLGLAFYLHPWI